jgi:protein TonB
MTGSHEPLTARRRPLTMRTMDPSDEQELGFYRRYRYLIWIGGAIILIAPITLAIKTLTATKQAPAKVAPITFVKLLPPATTPTPPPPQPQSTPRPQEQMLEQKRMIEPETKPEHPDEKPKADSKKAPPGPLGVNAKGEGQADSFGLVGRSGGNGLLDGGGGGGSRFGWYAAQIQARIEEALRENNRTRSASITGLRVRIWADNTGRVTRAQLIGSSGDPAIDSAIQNEVLTGLQLKQAPPSDMPMPIVLRVTAHRPS